MSPPDNAPKEREGKKEMSKSITQFVGEYVRENGRGCPKGVLIHVGGFKAKDIAAMLESGALESGRGSEGGIFVAGTKPTPKDRVSVSLKSRMADYLRTRALHDQVARELIREYDAELAKRADAQG
jgi:hypothetical protein